MSRAEGGFPALRFLVAFFPCLDGITNKLKVFIKITRLHKHLRRKNCLTMLLIVIQYIHRSKHRDTPRPSDTWPKPTGRKGRASPKGGAAGGCITRWVPSDRTGHPRLLQVARLGKYSASAGGSAIQEPFRPSSCTHGAPSRMGQRAAPLGKPREIQTLGSVRR